jgi:uncharacterized Tic20 family protein
MRKPIVLLVLGFTLLLSSAIPFGMAIHRAFSAREVSSLPITVGEKRAAQAVRVNMDHFVKLAVKMDIKTTSIKKKTFSDEDDKAQYHFPFSLRLTDQNGKTIYSKNSQISWKRGTRKYFKEEVGPQGGELIVETTLAEIRVPPPGKINAYVKLNDDDIYGAKAENIKLIIYDNVYKYYKLVIGGLTLLFIGIVLAAVGAIFLLVESAQGAAASHLEQKSDKEINKPVRDWAMWIHLSSLSGYLVPFGGLILPLVFWLTKKEQNQFIDKNGREAVNFRISMFIFYTVSFFLCFVLIGFLLIFVFSILDIIFTICAAAKANEGKVYRYPMTIRFINS